MVNNRSLLENYIGDDVELQRELLLYLDSLVDLSDFPGSRLKFARKDELSPLEKRFLGTGRERNKRLIKLIMNYAKKFDISDEYISNTMNARAFLFIMYKHHSYLKHDISLDNYEDSVLVRIFLW